MSKNTTDLQKLSNYLIALGLDSKCQNHPGKEQLNKEIELLKKQDIKIPLLEELTSTSYSEQVIVKGEFGEISIITGKVAFDNFEIYSLSGELFSGIRRYKTMTDCARTVYSLLTTGMFDEKIPRVWDCWTDFITDDLGPDGSTQEIINE